MTKFCSNLTNHLNFAKTNRGFQSANIHFFASKHVLLVLYEVWLNMTKFCSNLTNHLNFAKTNLFQSVITFFCLQRHSFGIISSLVKYDQILF